MSQARRKPTTAQTASAQAKRERERHLDPIVKRKLMWWAVSIVGLAAFVILFWKGPWWIDGTHIRESDLQPADGVVITGFRTGLVALAAGLIAGAGLWYTHKSHQHTERLFEHTREKDREQAELTREGQVTGRYVEAIKLLASEKEHEQLGGIYSLERIMRDSDKDRITVVEVLAAYARSNLARSAGSEEDARPTTPPAEVTGANGFPLTPLPEAVRAVLSVLGRNWREEGHRRPDLRSLCLDGRDASEIDLSGAWMTGAQLENCFLRRAKLRHATLTRASLSGARLNQVQADGAKLDEADLVGADLRAGRLNGVNLRESLLAQARLNHAALFNADLSGASLEGADLSDASLASARLVDVDFDGATLSGANLDRAEIANPRNLTAEQLCRARIYPTTKIPEGLAQHPQVQARIAQCVESARAGTPPPQWNRTLPN